QRYLQLVQQGSVKEALDYSRENFAPYFASNSGQEGALKLASSISALQDKAGDDATRTSRRTDDEVSGTLSGLPPLSSGHRTPLVENILSLMGVLVYANRLESSPYKDLFAATQWEEVAQLFTHAFCTLLGIASESPLATAVRAGSLALPVIIKMSRLVQNSKVEWSRQDELPAEVPLPDNLRFHSVFICPVSKERATKKNPPMMMPCGHVICKESLEKLAKDTRPSIPSMGRF
ncbi:hypothetical protein EV182_008095, partial [Spiromyces aspiralis]